MWELHCLFVVGVKLRRKEASRLYRSTGHNAMALDGKETRKGPFPFLGALDQLLVCRTSALVLQAAMWPAAGCWPTHSVA